MAWIPKNATRSAWLKLLFGLPSTPHSPLSQRGHTWQ
jgi:hypothetical protein